MLTDPPLPPPIADATSEAEADRSGLGLGRRYWALWSAVGFSGIGDGMVLAAFPLLAARLTTDPRLVAGVTVASTVPNLAAVHLGALVDRSDRRRLVTGVELFRAVLLVAFGLTLAAGVRPSIVTVFGVVFLIGLGRTVTETAAQVALPEIVDDAQLGRANGLLSSAETLSEHMAGQALGGVLFVAALSLPFILDGVSFFLSAVLLAVALPAVAATGVVDADVNRGIKAGFAYFRRDPVLRPLAVTIVAFAFCQSMMLAPLVLFVTGPLDLGEGGYGILLAVTSIGGIIGGAFAGRIDRAWRTDTILIAAGLFIASGYLIAGATTSVVLVGAGLVIEAFWVVVGNVASITLRQRVISDGYLGRVSGIFRFLIVGAFPLGALTGGVLADAVELRTPLLMAAGVQLLAISLLGPRLSRAIRTDPRSNRS